MILNKIHVLYVLISLFPISLYAQETPEVRVGGALRFNYNNSSFKKDQQERGGDFGYDVFLLKANAQYKDIKMNAEYRFYSEDFGGGMLKSGYLGYDINKKDEIQLGLTKVPFGNETYNSNSWFFSLNYYVGLEDDYDMGVKYSHKGKKIDYDVAFFKNSEELRFGNNSDVSDSRYSYDISSKDIDGDGTLDLRNKEVNQINGRIVYKIDSKNIKHRIGGSAELGQVYNLDTKENGTHSAFAAQYTLEYKKLNIKAQYTNYRINPKNPDGETDKITAMTAYGYPYFIASKADIYTVGAAYSIPVKSKLLEKITLYNDFGYMDKKEKTFENSMMNVSGAMLTMGNVYTYIDFALGKNMSWLNNDFDNSFAQGSSYGNDLEYRFNINIGYYF